MGVQQQQKQQQHQQHSEAAVAAAAEQRQTRDGARRDLVWSFAGEATKADRPVALGAFLRAFGGRPHLLHHTSGIFGKPKRAADAGAAAAEPTPIPDLPDLPPLNASDYAAVMRRSVFCPSPQGFWNADSFRVYEALEAGCIPVVLRRTQAQPFDYWANSLGAGHPLLVDDAWEAAAEAARGMADGKDGGEGLAAWQAYMEKWWVLVKARLRAAVRRRVEEAVGVPGVSGAVW